jgi:hypothetical protein
MIGAFLFGQVADMDLLNHFLDKTFMWHSGCWQWTGAIGGHTKYGNYYDREKGRKFVAHRWIYEKLIGKIGDGLQAHHACEVPTCVNPYHIILMTPKQHAATKRHHHRDKTHCKHGHELTDDNVWLRDRGETIERVCRTCKRANDRKRYREWSVE